MNKTNSEPSKQLSEVKSRIRKKMKFLIYESMANMTNWEDIIRKFENHINDKMNKYLIINVIRKRMNTVRSNTRSQNYKNLLVILDFVMASKNEVFTLIKLKRMIVCHNK